MPRVTLHTNSIIDYFKVSPVISMLDFSVGKIKIKKSSAKKIVCCVKGIAM